MNRLWQAIVDWFRAVVTAWDRFWFTPTDPATLSLLRILAGAMLFYTHLVWSIDLEAFFGPEAWISNDLLREMWQGEQLRSGDPTYYWTYFTAIDSPAVLWTVHIGALIIFAMLTLGLFSRVVAVLAYLAALAYLHRVPTAWFGLDQINVMLAMYLMLGPCGARYSLDRVIARRRGRAPSEPLLSVSANVAIRLIQIHMCVIYFFAGMRKMSGPLGSWWEGSAMWWSVANLEYQSIDLTWLAGWPAVIAFMTHLTIFFEVGYAALIWPRLTRPVFLLMAVAMHIGIATSLGLATFGLAMIIANLSFLTPALVRSVLERKTVSQPAPGAA